VSPEMGKSYPGARAKGTQHRGGKGAGQSTGQLLVCTSYQGDRGTLRECPPQVDACVERVRVNGDSTPTCAVNQGVLVCDWQPKAPARGCPVEAVGVWSFRMKMKRRKASVMGKVALSTKALFSLVSQAYWRRDDYIIYQSYPERSAGPRFAVGLREMNEGR